jgi:hypothetical protein
MVNLADSTSKQTAAHSSARHKTMAAAPVSEDWFENATFI